MKPPHAAFRALLAAGCALVVLAAGAAAAQVREFSGRIERVEPGAIVVDSRLGDTLRFERGDRVEVVDERGAADRKGSWRDLAPGDWVSVQWRLTDQPRTAHRVIVLPPRREGADRP